ncbi:hypothetical protein SASPL_104527 [Salvia splendens]|uniref:Proteasome assembly chaperone 2 n=1 Tax=Salvia splendens TaxID=180675 RepID=A0A8X8YJE0_SALSN|nr:hypothetical protein SASPL_104527 [Salvia splendens]
MCFLALAMMLIPRRLSEISSFSRSILMFVNLGPNIAAYESSSSALTLVQQRSPVLKGMMVAYAKNIANFAATNGKKHVVLLSSLDFGRWRNIDMSSGLQIYYLSSSNLDGTDSACESLGWKRLQNYDPALRTWKYLDTLAQVSVRFSF